MRSFLPGAASTASSGRDKPLSTISRSRSRSQRSLVQTQLSIMTAAEAASKAQRMTDLWMDVLRTGERIHDPQWGLTLQISDHSCWLHVWAGCFYSKHHTNASRQQQHGCNP